ncbi:hypothetical protein RIF29_22121 [Crotalaria pallida]|uniref:Uncharacterized protein n=1 Tax=Crotalaria pallida TaxID=3830 RepID=A0AAN9IA33_CROPI
MQRRKLQLHIVNDNATTSPSGREKGSTKAKNGNKNNSLGNGKCAFEGKKNEPQGDSGDGKEWHFTRELGNNEPVVAATALSKRFTLEESLESDGTAASEGKQNRKDKKLGKTSLPLLSYLNKKKRGWNDFIKGRIKFGRDGVTRFSHVRRKMSSCRLDRIRSKIMVIGLKLKMVRSMIKRKVRKQSKHDLEQGHENGDELKGEELCRKRILMGVRCKPLCSSGILRYDEDGLFLPENSSLTRTPCHFT